MPRQGLSGLTAAKVQQKNELTKYFGKKVQILYKKRYNTDINIYDVLRYSSKCNCRVNLLKIQLFPFWKILPQIESDVAQCSII